MRNRTVTLLAVLFSVLATQVVHAREQTIVFGGENGWGSPNLLDGLTRVAGLRGRDDLQLMPYRYDVDSQTELLLHFDAASPKDSAGRFAVSVADPELSQTTRAAGTASLLVDGPGDAVDLLPTGSTLFSPGVEWGSFTLEFRLYPVTLTTGERIIDWSAHEGTAGDFRLQRILAEVANERLRFTFENFFIPPDGSAFTVMLEGDSGLVPRRWSRHVVRFDADTGLLEYLVDGRTVAVTHATETGRERGSVYFPRIAAFAGDPIHLVPAFTGALDEVRLVRRFEPDRELPRYAPGGGVYESLPLDLGSPGAILRGVSTVARTPGMTDVFVYYRTSDTRVGERTLDGAWIPVNPTEPFVPRSGRFVQIRAELLPDARTTASPSLSEIRLTVMPDPPPPPPVGLTAVPHDGSVDLSWEAVRQEDIQGYLVYYGVKPGRYFGLDGDLGPSPIDVGQATAITLSGLENGTLYYFAVSAYDAAGVREETGLSAEAAARPAKVYR